MNIEKAKNLIERSLIQMRAICQEPIFNEWAIISTENGRIKLLHFQTEGDETRKNSFFRDISIIAEQMNERQFYPGEFEFTSEGHNQYFDAFVCLGQDLFALFNNLTLSTEGFTANPMWKRAQAEFVALSHLVMSDPVVNRS